MMITDIEDYFKKGCGRCDRFGTDDCSAHKWNDGIKSLRQICLNLGMSEHVKWGHPCYMAHGRNICIIGAFRGDFRLTFMNASLLKDAAKILERQGENTQNPDMIRFTQNDQVLEKAHIIQNYLIEAIEYAKLGIKAEKATRELEFPEELVDALDADSELAEAFVALSKGRQNSYIFHLNTTKNSATRITRIEKSRPKILAGLGQTEYIK